MVCEQFQQVEEENKEAVMRILEEAVSIRRPTEKRKRSPSIDHISVRSETPSAVGLPQFLFPAYFMLTFSCFELCCLIFLVTCFPFIGGGVSQEPMGQVQ